MVYISGMARSSRPVAPWRPRRFPDKQYYGVYSRDNASRYLVHAVRLSCGKRELVRPYRRSMACQIQQANLNVMEVSACPQSAVDDVVQLVRPHQGVASKSGGADGKHHWGDHIEPTKPRKIRSDFFAQRDRQIVAAGGGISPKRQHTDTQP
jgi:hypothetical protein